MSDHLAPFVSPARYAKGKCAVHCPSDGSGMRTRAMRLAAAMSSRYSGREHAYIMSSGGAAKLVRLYAAGRDAHLSHKRGKLGWVLDD